MEKINYVRRSYSLRPVTNLCPRNTWFNSRLGLSSCNVSAAFPSPVRQTLDSEFNPAVTTSLQNKNYNSITARHVISAINSVVI
jgi:hypothetical protein